MYKILLKPVLFSMDPERAHHWAMWALRLASKVPGVCWVLERIYGFSSRELAQDIWGIRFPNPVGLAAGFDKNSQAVPALSRMGFGFLEVGAISSEPRPGNPRPRIFRLKEDAALINRMGLPNPGAHATARRLKALRSRSVPILANIVKNPELEGDVSLMVADYVRTLREVFPWVDGFTINVSCPATPNLKAFHDRDALYQLLKLLKEERDCLAEQHGERKKPLIVKVSPDMSEVEKETLLKAHEDGLLDGLVLTNTTTRRPATLKTKGAVLQEAGGLSGPPLFPLSLALVSEFGERSGGRLPVIAVGGITTVEQARKMLEAGACLVEIYTAFIYEGPGLPARLARGLLEQGWLPRHRG